MRKLWILPALFLSLVLSSVMVLAANAITVQTPASWSNVSGSSQLLNSTLDTNDLNATNITYFYTFGRFDSWTKIGTVDNVTAQQTGNWNLTWDTTTFTNHNNLTINATTYNWTGQVVGTSVRTIQIGLDNGAPDATYGGDTIADLKSINSGDSFGASISADSTKGIHNCTVYMSPSGNNVIINASGSNACTGYTFFPSNFSITTEGNYIMQIEVRDMLGNVTNSTARTVTIYFPSGGGLGGGGGGGSAEEAVSATPAETTAGTEQSFTGEAGEGGGGNVVTRFFSRIGNAFRNLFSRIGALFGR